jgi:stringent starvation protein A
MILYEHPLSSYAQKVKIALREKGVAFERSLPADFGTGRRDTPFAATNPRTEVPVLVLDDQQAIFESTVILEYIEERWPEPKLLPSDPLARAEARMTEEVCDTQYEAVNWGFGELL